MSKYFLLFLFFVTSLCDAETISFIAPKGWQCISNKEELPAKVEIVYIGSGKGGFTPSINLAREETPLSLVDYTKLAKSYHESHGGTRCIELGSIDSQAGSASILQIDRPTQWGQVRFLQGLVLKEKTAYVMTATCLQEEFTVLYPQFIKAIETLTIEEKS